MGQISLQEGHRVYLTDAADSSLSAFRILRVLSPRLPGKPLIRLILSQLRSKNLMLIAEILSQSCYLGGYIIVNKAASSDFFFSICCCYATIAGGCVIHCLLNMSL